MGRNARRRAEKREEERQPGLAPDEEHSKEGRERCPRCGSTHLVAMQRMLGVPPVVPGVDVVCVNCNWQGKLGPGY